MASQIVVVTDQRDAHLPYVQRHLADQMLVVDPLDVAKGKTLSFACSDNGMQVIYDGQVLDPKSIWFRKPGNAKDLRLAIGEKYTEYAVDALQKHFFSLMSSFTNAYWLSDVFAINKASDKPLQIAIAKQLGFAVPDTLFTSDAEAAGAFIASHGECILKTLVPFIEKVGENRQKTLYASKVSIANMPDLRGLHQTPLIFQQIVPPKYDVRVTVVRDKVFAARIIHSSDDRGVRDWRMGHFEGNLIIERDEQLPKDIAEKCIEHVRRLGLQFGAIDLVVDRQGIYWFLENNPNGQWAFVEKETGQPIGGAIAELLTSPPSK